MMNSATIFDYMPRRYVWDDATRFYMAYPGEIPDELLPTYGYLLLKRKALHVELNSNSSFEERAHKKRKLEPAPPVRGYRYLDYDRGLKKEARRKRRAMRRLAAGTRYVPEPMDIDGPEVNCLMAAEVPVVFDDVVVDVVVDEVEEDEEEEEEEVAEEEEELVGSFDEEEDSEDDQDLQSILKGSSFYQESSDDDDDDFLADLSLPGSDA